MKPKSFTVKLNFHPSIHPSAITAYLVEGRTGKTVSPDIGQEAEFTLGRSTIYHRADTWRQKTIHIHTYGQFSHQLTLIERKHG